jgi:Tol biopolymer transport system component
MRPRYLLLGIAGVLAVALVVAIWPSRESISQTDVPTRIAFMTDRDGDFEVYIMERDGSAPLNLTSNAASDGLPAWSEQGRVFAFLTTRGTPNLAVYRMGADGGNRIALSVDPAGDADPPVWSPTGDWIAFGNLDGANSDIYLVDAEGDTIRNLTDHPAMDRFGDWSPDGQHIAFVSDRDGTVGIYTVDINGGQPTRLTDADMPGGAPAWSPDGRKIAFMSNRDGNVEVYVMGSDGSNPVRLTQSVGFDGYPAWSPDGTKIAFLTDRDGNPEIYVMGADGSEVTNLSRNPAQESVQGDFSWSPDGTQILFHTDRDGNVEVYVMDADGGNPTNLTSHPGSDTAATWVPTTGD